tara:strand:- start:117 stop:926 length:810 start_codon:yes stop_codon:yes gene_type:complete
MTSPTPANSLPPELPDLAALAQAGPRPLFATLSGSHLYGFPSPDSDFDLRGAFVAPLRRVLGLGTLDETYVREDPAFELAGRTIELDWVAHEVGKYCRLLQRADGVILEQVYSPLVVIESAWLDELRELARGCVAKVVVNHYRGFFRNKRQELTKKPSVKSLLYAYRVALTGVHALSSGEIEANLEVLAGLYPALAPPGLVELIARKRAGEEGGLLDEHELAAQEPALAALEAGLEAAHEASSLPFKPTSGPGLSDFVVRARLALGGAP